jgi:hypothetical protein
MGRKAGSLLWNRKRVQLGGGQGDVVVDTGLIQPNTGFGDYSPGEPPMGGTPDPDGVGSRIQVIPMAPLDAWAGVTHEEPIIGPDGTITVKFSAEEGSPLINVLFWDPHSMVGPGEADPYTEELPQ